MDYLLDTNHWSFLQRRHPMVVDRLARLPQSSTLFMPVVAQAELLTGVELVTGAKRRHELMTLYQQSVEECTDILPVDAQVAEQFAAVFVQPRRDGHMIETNDIWVAAIGRAHNLIVVSSDVHFQYIRGIQVEDWTKPGSEA